MGVVVVVVVVVFLAYLKWKQHILVVYHYSQLPESVTCRYQKSWKIYGKTNQVPKLIISAVALEDRAPGRNVSG